MVSPKTSEEPTGPVARRLREAFSRTLAACDGRILTERTLSEAPFSEGRYHLLGIGKAAPPMANAVRALLGSLVKRTLLVVPDGVSVPSDLPGAIVHRAGHPFPDKRSVEAGESVLGFVSRLGAHDRLIVVLSGGGSALLCAPATGLTLEDVQETNRALLRHPLAIHEINALRKHISRIKGGRLGLMSRAETVVLALSDVPTGELTTLASGPFAADPTTFQQALAVARQIGAPSAVIEALERAREETPKPGDQRLRHVRTLVVGTPRTLRDEARAALESDGFTVQTLPMVKGTRVEELAYHYGAIARQVVATGEPRAWVAVGEPSVTLPEEPGRGGRCSHLAVLVAQQLRDVPDTAFLAAGSDGVDGNSELCGGVIDQHTWTASKADQAVQRYNTADYLETTGAAIRTGPTQTNLTDVHMLAVWKQ